MRGSDGGTQVARFGGPTLICVRITDVEQTTLLRRRDTVGE